MSRQQGFRGAGMRPAANAAGRRQRSLDLRGKGSQAAT